MDKLVFYINRLIFIVGLTSNPLHHETSLPKIQRDNPKLSLTLTPKYTPNYILIRMTMN